jgi:acyl carrier protein
LADTEHLQDVLKAFVLKEFLEGEDPSELEATTELITGGILDSLGMLKLITFLEQEYAVTIHPREADEAHFNSIAQIAELVASKLGNPS